VGLFDKQPEPPNHSREHVRIGAPIAPIPPARVVRLKQADGFHNNVETYRDVRVDSYEEDYANYLRLHAMFSVYAEEGVKALMGAKDDDRTVTATVDGHSLALVPKKASA
jgi:hypothetical protein